MAKKKITFESGIQELETLIRALEQRLDVAVARIARAAGVRVGRLREERDVLLPEDALEVRRVVAVLLFAAGIDIIDVTVITAKKNRKSCKKERGHENKTDNSKACRMA